MLVQTQSTGVAGAGIQSDPLVSPLPRPLLCMRQQRTPHSASLGPLRSHQLADVGINSAGEMAPL